MSQDRNSVFTQETNFDDRPINHDLMPKRNVMQDDFGFEAPVESVPLPSNGLVYPQGSVLHGLDSIEIKAMTAKEEDILTSRALIKKGTVISHLLNNCILTRGVNSDMLLSGDRNAIMIALRITGYGSDYHVNVNCPSCGEKSDQDFSLSDLGIKRLEIQPVEFGRNEFEFLLPKSQKKIRFKFMTGRDEQEILETQERMKKTGGVGNNLVTQKLKAAIVAVDGITERSKIELFIQNMPAMDSNQLRKFIDEQEPGVDMSVEMDCPHCDTRSSMRLPLGPSFFWPDSAR
jgi:hypothetical protein